MNIVMVESKKSMSTLKTRFNSHEGGIHEVRDKSEEILRMWEREKIGKKLGHEDLVRVLTPL